MTWTKEMVKEAMEKVVDKAARDEDFRELCKLSIHGAVKEVTGLEVPISTKILVIDNTGYHMSVVLPPLQTEEEALSESELEMVAGGTKSVLYDLDRIYSDIDRAIGQVFEPDYRKQD